MHAVLLFIIPMASSFCPKFSLFSDTTILVKRDTGVYEPSVLAIVWGLPIIAGADWIWDASRSQFFWVTFEYRFFIPNWLADRATTLSVAACCNDYCNFRINGFNLGSKNGFYDIAVLDANPNWLKGSNMSSLNENVMEVDAYDDGGTGGFTFSIDIQIS